MEAKDVREFMKGGILRCIKGLTAVSKHFGLQHEAQFTRAAVALIHS